MFSTLPKANLSLSLIFILLSAVAFNWDKSKIVSFRKELTAILSEQGSCIISGRLLPVQQSRSLVTTRPIPYLHQTSSVLRRSPLELLSIAGIIYYTTSSLVIDIQCTRYKNAFNKRF